MIRFKASLIAPALLALSLAGGAVALAQSDEDQPKPSRQTWSFHGVFGTFDQAQLQRGFQVYKEVCSNCHRLSIPFRTLENPNGPGYSDAQVKTLAASYQVTNEDPNDKGEMYKRPATPADVFPPPDAFPNDAAAAANFGWQKRANTSVAFPISCSIFSTPIRRSAPIIFTRS
jgi:ubiquinol-cytochrome c reductase cytochrome c1 subunit